METTKPESQNQIALSDIERAWLQAVEFLAREQSENGHWVGRLSTSALSTATAVSAMVLMRSHAAVLPEQKELVDGSIEGGCRWLLDAQNDDGGFGDTDLSHSNVATTLLVLAAWRLTEFDSRHRDKFNAAMAYADRVGKWNALRTRYGKDKTFVVPILTNCALAGLVDWVEVPALPFEAAWLPQSWYRLAQMPVVSYAVPALVAMGQAKFYYSPPGNFVLRAVRRRACEPTLSVLARMQPTSGGYLEAVPLTSFVLMSLASIGKGELPVAQRCLKFVLDSKLDDGSWPIDTNLATWVTSLAICALGRKDGRKIWRQNKDEAEPCRMKTGLEELVTPKTIRWLLSCQHLGRHAFTGAEPGGWGWTNLSGAVPDADDTPAALIALAKWFRANSESHPILNSQLRKSIAAGLRWLIRLQNRDGGWPTFCRGWGKLPFDRSGTDLTAHALRAINAWQGFHEELRTTERSLPARKELELAQKKGLDFLSRQQRNDGSWLPLWFGNQDCENDENAIYGTSKVILAYGELGFATKNEAESGLRFLETSQNADDGWGGGTSVRYRVGEAETASHGSSLEETAVALEALLVCNSGEPYTQTIMSGLRWLIAAVDEGRLAESWPIGFYFAKLWYYERMYPAIFAASALGAAFSRRT